MVTRLDSRGFTFVEVMAILLVVTIGIGGVVALVMYGTRLSSRAQAETISMATAISVAHDPQPALALDWVYNPIDINSPNSQSAESRGYVNGLYVVRRESSTPIDIIARSTIDGLVHARSSLVEVSVYEAMLGDPVTSYATRIVRIRKAP